MARAIALFDLDCFYAQVEMLKRPAYTGPLSVRQKGLLVTSNYVRSAPLPAPTPSLLRT